MKPTHPDFIALKEDIEYWLRTGKTLRTPQGTYLRRVVEIERHDYVVVDEYEAHFKPTREVWATQGHHLVVKRAAEILRAGRKPWYAEDPAINRAFPARELICEMEPFSFSDAEIHRWRRAGGIVIAQKGKLRLVCKWDDKTIPRFGDYGLIEPLFWDEPGTRFGLSDIGATDWQKLTGEKSPAKAKSKHKTGAGAWVAILIILALIAWALSRGYAQPK